MIYTAKNQLRTATWTILTVMALVGACLVAVIGTSGAATAQTTDPLVVTPAVDGAVPPSTCSGTVVSYNWSTVGIPPNSSGNRPAKKACLSGLPGSSPISATTSYFGPGRINPLLPSGSSSR
jgi:hypothetical protein